jgi:hypothetical protein
MQVNLDGVGAAPEDLGDLGDRLVLEVVKRNGLGLSLGKGADRSPEFVGLPGSSGSTRSSRFILASALASLMLLRNRDTDRFATTRRTHASGLSYCEIFPQFRCAATKASCARSSAADRLPDRAYASPITDRSSRS